MCGHLRIRELIFFGAVSPSLLFRCKCVLFFAFHRITDRELLNWYTCLCGWYIVAMRSGGHGRKKTRKRQTNDSRGESGGEKENCYFHFIIAHQASVCTRYLRLSSIDAFVTSAELSPWELLALCLAPHWNTSRRASHPATAKTTNANIFASFGILLVGPCRCRSHVRPFPAHSANARAFAFRRTAKIKPLVSSSDFSSKVKRKHVEMSWKMMCCKWKYNVITATPEWRINGAHSRRIGNRIRRITVLWRIHVLDMDGHISGDDMPASIWPQYVRPAAIGPRTLQIEFRWAANIFSRNSLAKTIHGISLADNHPFFARENRFLTSFRHERSRLGEKWDANKSERNNQANCRLLWTPFTRLASDF